MKLIVHFIIGATALIVLNGGGSSSAVAAKLKFHGKLFEAHWQGRNIGAPEKTRDLVLTGEIKAGDLARLRRLAPKPNWFVIKRKPAARLRLNSIGGNFVQAVKMAQHVWEAGIPTYIGPGDKCLSACAIIFMSGSHWVGDGVHFTNRTLHVKGSLGFHAPFLNPAALSRVPKTAILQTGLTAAVDFLRLSHMAQWPSTLVLELLKVQKRNKFLAIDTVDKAGRWKIALEGYRPITINKSHIPQLCSNAMGWVKAQSSVKWRGVFDNELVRKTSSGAGYSVSQDALGGCNVSVTTDTNKRYVSVSTGRPRINFLGFWAVWPPETRLSNLAK